VHQLFLVIGSLEIHWYGVMAALAAFTAYAVLCLNRKFAGLTRDQAATIVFYFILVGGTVGARIFYVMLNWEYFEDRPWYEMLALNHGGLVFYGGFFLAAALIGLYCRRRKLSLVAVLDVLAPALALGHAVARIGCFLQGCCHGAATDSFLGVRYPMFQKVLAISFHPFSIRWREYVPQLSDLLAGGAKVYPVQLFESAGNLVLGLTLFYLVRKGRRGMAFSGYILGYGILRFCLEFIRGDAERGMWGWFSTSQLVALAVIPFGAAMFAFFATGKDASKSLEKKSSGA